MTAIARRSLIGQPVPKRDAPDKATGRATYLQDLAVPRMLVGKVLRADRSHARILGIDTAAAAALPGVHAVITAADTPGVPLGFAKDNPPLKGDKVRCVRDEIAAVAADSEEIAAHALSLIEVAYEDLPGLFSTADALAEGAPAVHAARPGNVVDVIDYAHGDIEQGERESDVVLEDRFEMQFVAHCCMGASAVIAAFDSRGNLTLHSQTQVPFLYRREIAPVVDVDPGRIRVIQPTIGGGFGSRLDIYPFEPIAVFLARRTRRPVKIAFDREEEFIASPTRQPVEVTLRSGVRRDGTLTFRDVRTLHDNGGYVSWGARTPLVMMMTFASLYRLPHCRYRTTIVYTNNPYSGSFRGFGNLQATFPLESHMDRLAEAIAMDPLEFRLRNAHLPGDVGPQGTRFTTCGFRECLTTAAARSDFTAKHRAHRAAPAGTGARRRGIGIAATIHVGGGAKIYLSDGCGTILKLDDFAHATVISGGTDIGQGLDTVLTQIVGEELGLEPDDVTVVGGDTAVAPWDVGVHASRSTFIAGNSARRAARKARERILEEAARQANVPAAALDLRGGHVVQADNGVAVIALDKLLRGLHFDREDADVIVAADYYEPPSAMQDASHRGDVSAAYTWACQIAEVEVDTATGIVRLLRVWSAHDVGRVINRLGIEGQIQGGVAMGAGYALTEDLVIERGRVVNPSFADYKLLTATEIPDIDIALIETDDPEGPYGAKGIGEAPIVPMAPAVANAVYNAVGIRFTKLPLTPERVLRALKGKEERAA